MKLAEKMKLILKKIKYLVLIPVLIFLIKLRRRHKQSIVLTKNINFVNRLLRDKLELLKHVIGYTKPFPIIDESDAEIHTCICHKDITQYILCLKSFLFFANIHIAVIVHDDGSLTKQDFVLLHKHFPGIQIYDYSSSTDTVKNSIDKFPNLKRERLEPKWNKNHLIIMFDEPFFAKKKKIVHLDSDILFYNYPSQLIKWITSNTDKTETLFIRDIGNYYSLSERVINIIYKKQPIPCLNSGLRCYWKQSTDPKEMEYLIDLLGRFNDLDYWRDQTYTLVNTLSHYKKVTMFDKNYIISPCPQVTKSTICIHYVTPVRNQLFIDGVTLLTTKMIDVFES
jgi:hypothetical protein